VSSILKDFDTLKTDYYDSYYSRGCGSVLGRFGFLGQGTLYPDILQSGLKHVVDDVPSRPPRRSFHDRATQTHWHTGGEHKPSRAMNATATTKSNSRLVSIRDAATETGLPEGSLRRLIADGELESIELPGIRRLWLDRELLNAAIDSWSKK
jgi:hypothetical protein